VRDRAPYPAPYRLRAEEIVRRADAHRLARRALAARERPCRTRR